MGGVRNPSEGGQHIRSMTSLHQEKCQEFIHHLVRSHRGRISSIAADLSKWSSGFNSDYQTDASIQQILNENGFISTIRQTLGISAYSPEMSEVMNDDSSAQAIKATRPDSLFSVLSEEDEPEIIEDNSGTISAATDSITPSSSVVITKPKKKHLTAAERFTEGMIAGIEGNIDTMLTHFENAASKNHAEAAWYMWLYLDRDSQSPEEKKEALEYLDIACRGLFHLAPLKVKELYRESPSIATPYLEQLQRQATKKGASSTTMNALGEHYAYVVDDAVKADYWYKQAIEKDSNPNALLNLRALHVSYKEWFFVSEEDSAAYSDYIQSHAGRNSKPRFLLDRSDLIESMRHFHHTKNNAEIIQLMTQKMDRGSITATIVYHIGCLHVSKGKKGARTNSKNENLDYLSHITRYASGSTGNDSDYNIDYTTSYTDENAILAQVSTIPISTLIGYYQKTNSSVNLHYWETYRQCMGEKRTFFPEVPPAEKKQIGIFLGALMGDGVRSASKLQGDSFIITAALLPTIDPAQRERAKMRLTAYNVPFREEKDGTVLLPETTHAKLSQAYRTMMELHQANCKSTVPTSMVTATSSITDQVSGGKKGIGR